MQKVVSGFVKLKEGVSKDVGRDLKEDIGRSGGMNRLLSDSGIQLCEDGTHRSHSLFTTGLLFVPNVASFQHAYTKGRRMRYHSIALGGGGMRGAVHLGALKALREVQGSLEFPNGIYGSSVGAIGAAMVAFNVPVETIESVFTKYYTRSAWIPTPHIGHAWGIPARKGVFTMDKMREMLVSVFTECGIKDVETKRICDAPQTLYIIASNLSTRRPAILTGEVPLLQALLCSCCIPGLFVPQILYGDVYLDAFVYTRRVERVVPPGTLVLVLRDIGEKITPKSSMSDILYACVAGNTISQDSIHVCYFKNIGIGVIEEVTAKQREEMIQQGYLQTLSFMAKMAAKEG